MSPQEKQKLLADVLAWVNEIRAEHDLPPLSALKRGSPMAAYDCPLALSLAGIAPHVAVLPGYFRCFSSSEVLLAERRSSDRIEEFVRAFDRGEIPELVAVVA